MAKLTYKTFMADLKRSKKGILIGLGVGLIAAYYAISQGADLNTIVDAGKGLADSIFQRQAAVEVAKYKIYLVFGFVGAVVGYISEKIMNRRR